MVQRVGCRAGRQFRGRRGGLHRLLPAVLVPSHAVGARQKRGAGQLVLCGSGEHLGGLLRQSDASVLSGLVFADSQYEQALVETSSVQRSKSAWAQGNEGQGAKQCSEVGRRLGEKGEPLVTIELYVTAPVGVICGLQCVGPFQTGDHGTLTPGVVHGRSQGRHVAVHRCGQALTGEGPIAAVPVDRHRCRGQLLAPGAKRCAGGSQGPGRLPGDTNTARDAA